MVPAPARISRVNFPLQLRAAKGPQVSKSSFSAGPVDDCGSYSP